MVDGSIKAYGWTDLDLTGHAESASVIEPFPDPSAAPPRPRDYTVLHDRFSAEAR